MRQLARYKVAEANTFAMRGDWWRTTNSALDTIQLGNDIALNNGFLSRLVGSAIIAIGRSGVESHADAIAGLSASQALQTSKRLEKLLQRRVTFSEALQRDAVNSLVEFQNLTKTPHWRRAFTEKKGWQGTLLAKPFSEIEIYNNIVMLQNIAIQNSKKSWGTPAIPPSTDENDPISPQFVTSSDVRFSEGRELMGLDLLLLRLALRAYQAEHGAFPERLSELAPSYLKNIPTDYFAAGAPLHYRRIQEGYLLWSIGPDGIDNGGTPVPPRNGATLSSLPATVPDNSQGDWVAGKNR